MLDLLGIDAQAEGVYRALLEHPRDDVDALARRLNLGVEQVRASLDSLSEVALVRPSWDRPGALRAVSPEVGLEMLLARQQAELAIHQQRIQMSRSAAAQLIAEYSGIRSLDVDGVEQLIGLDAIRDRLIVLTDQATDEIMTLAPGGAQTAENMEASKPLNHRLIDRGVRIRTVYLDSVRNDGPTVAHAKWLSGIGAQVRTAPELPTRLLIMDRRVALIPVRNDNTSQGAVLLSGHGMLAALCALFEGIWDASEPLGSPARNDANGLSAQWRRALTLLAEGYTDEAIGVKLGISTRTARRITSELMERLGARSRFQAGVHAVRRGWLDGAVP